MWRASHNSMSSSLLRLMDLSSPPKNPTAVASAADRHPNRELRHEFTRSPMHQRPGVDVQHVTLKAQVLYTPSHRPRPQHLTTAPNSTNLHMSSVR